jgi:RpiR family carbohydrate utilization transcriptional regulator
MTSGSAIACLALADYERSTKTIAKTFEVLSTKRV